MKTLKAPRARHAGFFLARRPTCTDHAGRQQEATTVLALHLNGEDVLALPALEDAPRDASPARAALDRANALLDAGKMQAAADLCLATLQNGRLAPMTAANLVMVLRAAGDVATADRIATIFFAQIAAGLTDATNSVHRRINLGRLKAVMGYKDDAEILLTHALQDDPTHQSGVLTLTRLLLQRGAADAAMACWQPIFAAAPTDGVLRLNLVRILAQSGFLGHARALLDKAEPLCTTNRAEFDHVAAALRGTHAGTAQAAMTLEVFERFASSYDQTLAKLGNSGPDAVAAILHQLALPAKRSMAVLDAGCGTGLCGALLRPYARRLHGVDLSPAMLAKARKKKTYDALSRADLATAGTLPQGPFDLIVSSDVLVYFGALDHVLTNFAGLLRPGGWLVLTVEDAGAALATGWTLSPSGRHKHDLAYLDAILRKTGFATPKVTHSFDLRHEFGMPVRGLGLAAQRLALFG
jgi:predicted TPR repeat methyltransferase